MRRWHCCEGLPPLLVVSVPPSNRGRGRMSSRDGVPMHRRLMPAVPRALLDRMPRQSPVRRRLMLAVPRAPTGRMSCRDGVSMRYQVSLCCRYTTPTEGMLDRRFDGMRRLMAAARIDWTGVSRLFGKRRFYQDDVAGLR